MNNNNTIKKYLIFTEYESTLNTKLTSILEKWNLKYDRIKGSSLTINKQIEKYRQSDNELNVLLILIFLQFLVILVLLICDFVYLMQRIKL